MHQEEHLAKCFAESVGLLRRLNAACCVFAAAPQARLREADGAGRDASVRLLAGKQKVADRGLCFFLFLVVVL